MQSSTTTNKSSMKHNRTKSRQHKPMEWQEEDSYAGTKPKASSKRKAWQHEVPEFSKDLDTNSHN